LAGEGEGFGQGLDAQLRPVDRDEADLTGADAIVVPVLG
jgi:hypothetical protein